MEQIELTLKQSLKVLWSFFWRTYVLMMPLMFVCMFIIFFFVFDSLPFPKEGQAVPPPPPDMKMIPVFFVVWVVAVFGGIALQAVALKWALKAKWSDFKIIVVSAKPDDQTKINSELR